MLVESESRWVIPSWDELNIALWAIRGMMRVGSWCSGLGCAAHNGLPVCVFQEPLAAEAGLFVTGMALL